MNTQNDLAELRQAIEPQAGPGPTVEELRALGYSLLPLPPKAKEPPPKGWKEHAEPYEIPAEDNVAVAVGERSHGLAVLITNDDTSTTWATEKYGPPTVRSRRGGHWWFKAPSGTANEANAKTEVGQMELHAAHGKYVVIPPSIHPSGVPYTWSGGPTSNLPALPDLRDLWHPGGTHHTELLRQSAAKAHDGKDAETIFRELTSWRNAHLPDPHAHPDRELRKLAESAVAKFQSERLPAEARPPRSPSDLWDDKGKPVRARFVEALMEEARFLTVRDNGDLFVYREGFYRTDSLPFIRSWVEEQFRARGETSSGQFAMEVVESIRRRSYRPRSDFNPAGKLCLANGVLDLASLTVSPHTPEVPFTFRLPVDFAPEATCPTFDRFLGEVLPEPDNRETVLRFVGYSLEPGNPYQVAFLGVGGGNNGKSTLLGVLRDLLGPESVSSETLQSLSEGRFGTANLWGKLANICADIPASPIRYTGTFKLLTGGVDDVRAENKFGKPFYFQNAAKLLFSANELPPIRDDTSYAFWRRWVIVPFPADFTGREDRNLSAKLRAELSGILNRALGGLRALRVAGGFNSQGAGELREEWKRRSEPLYAFVKERLEITTDGWVRKEDLYEAYAEFASERNLPALKPEEVGRLLPKYVPSVRPARHRVPNPDPKGKERTVAVRGWEGVQFRPWGDTDPPDTPATPVTPAIQGCLAVAGVSGVTGGPVSVRALDAAREAVAGCTKTAESCVEPPYLPGMERREGSLAPDPPLKKESEKRWPPNLGCQW